MIELLPAPTAWVSVDDAPVPEDVWLMLYTPPSPDMELGFEFFPCVVTGFYSSISKCFLSENHTCLSESMDITHYSVITAPSGEVIRVARLR